MTWPFPERKPHGVCKSIEHYVVEDRGYDTACWIWQRGKMRNGYGVIRIAGKLVGAHIYAYRQVRGPVPDGMELDHLCRVRDCVNPSHTEPVTHAENGRRGSKAKITAAQVAEIRQRRGAGEKLTDIAVDYGIVAHIALGHRWKGVMPV